MARVIVEVSGVGSDQGVVTVGAYVEADFKRFGGGPPASRAQAAARRGHVRLELSDLAPGRYAVAAYHDANDNGKLDLTQVGTPAEGRGYSGVARAALAPPTFEQAAFDVGADDVVVPVALTYPSSG